MSSYDYLLTKDRSVSIHHKNIQNLAIEMFKIKSNLTPKIVNDLFYNGPENNYDLGHHRDLKAIFVNLVYNGSKSISYLSPKIWDVVPPEITEINSLSHFKKSIRKLIPADCPLHLWSRFSYKISES